MPETTLGARAEQRVLALREARAIVTATPEEVGGLIGAFVGNQGAVPQPLGKRGQFSLDLVMLAEFIVDQGPEVDAGEPESPPEDSECVDEGVATDGR